MMADQALHAEPFEDDFLNLAVDGFTMANLKDPEDFLFPEDSERTLSIWDDVDWWTGEAKTAPGVTDQMSSTAKEREQAEETFAASTPGSSAAFRAAEAATMGNKATQRWFQMENGRIPLDRLVKVGGNNYLRSDAAQAFRAMKRAAKKDGINITFSGAQSGYRDYATQERLFHEKGDSDTGGLAADPGTSNHGWGMAIDIGPEARAWVAQHGKRYGFHQLPTESWHFDFKPTADMEFRMPAKRSKKAPRRPVKSLRGRDVGGDDLTDKVPVTLSKGGFIDTIMSLVDDEVEADTVKGRRYVNLSDIPKPKNRDDIVAYARTVAKRYGWTGKQWLALYELGQRESGWDPEAVNEDSGATGIPQLLPSAHKVPKNWNDPRVQVRWFARYVSERYGDPLAAIKHHDQMNWY